VHGLFLQRAEQMSQREELLYRMRGVAAMLPSLQGQPPTASGAAEQGLLLRSMSDSLAGAELQQRVQTIAGGVGASFPSAETLTPDTAGRYRRIALRVTLSAPWPVFVRLLTAIRLASPRMVLDDLSLSPSRARGGEATNLMNGGFTVVAFSRTDPRE
jgi:general secretion pathway protein M